MGEGSRGVSRLEIILKYFKAVNVQIFAIQEPHLRTESDTLEQQMKKVNTLAKRAGYELMTQLTVGGMRGGGGLQFFGIKSGRASVRCHFRHTSWWYTLGTQMA